MSDQAALDLGTAAAHCKLVTGDVASPDFPRVIAEAVIKAAEASIRADEREQLRQLAADHGATYEDFRPCGCGGGCEARIRTTEPFADLIGGRVT